MLIIRIKSQVSNAVMVKAHVHCIDLDQAIITLFNEPSLRGHTVILLGGNDNMISIDDIMYDLSCEENFDTKINSNNLIKPEGLIRLFLTSQV